jgi:hypothetical protein
MARKKGRPAKGRRQPEPTYPAQFGVGSLVRVKPGNTVPGFEDIPLGGWAGTVREVDPRSEPPTYLIEWDRHTLDHMHPVYRQRCERDDLGLESMWLGEADIEPDTGPPAVMEQPTNIRSRPLDVRDQDDRVRIALRLTSDDPLPDVAGDSLRRYHAYLAGHLSFPFQGTFSQETGPLEDTAYPVTVVGLLDPEDADEMYGLSCGARQGRRQVELPLGEVEVQKGDPNRRPVKDYSYWFWNWR